jgi:deoxycytidylate deaminase
MESELPGLFRLAENVSKYSDCRIKMGCVLVDHSTPISVGFNKKKFFSKWCVPPKESIHAEMEALRTSGKDCLRGANIFVYRERKNGSLGMARPCENCMEKLKEFGVRKVFYTIDEFPYWKMEKINGL